MTSDYRFQYVPEYIIRNWKDSDGNVPYITRGSNEVFTSPLTDTFIEHMTPSVAEDVLSSSDALSNTHIIDCVRNIAMGDFSSLEDSVFWFSALISHLYYTNPYGMGRIDVVTHLYGDKIAAMKTREEQSEFLTRQFNEKRTTRDLVMMHELASVGFVYGFDLKCTVLEAPQDVDFALGMNPAFIFNASDNPAFSHPAMPLSANGTAVILPLSPRYALCLYDGGCLKVRKSGDTVSLSDEDVLSFNALMAKSGASLIFSPTEKYGDEYYAHIYDGMGDALSETNAPSFSFIRVLASSYSLDLPERKYSQMILDYDSKYVGKSADDISGDEFQNRIRYALSLAGSLSR